MPFSVEDLAQTILVLCEALNAKVTSLEAKLEDLIELLNEVDSVASEWLPEPSDTDDEDYDMGSSSEEKSD